MAATRLIALHKNKGKSVAACLKSRTDYAQNPDKTQQGELVSSYECSPLTVDEEFMLSKRQYELATGRRQKSDVIAYQIRQSFKPGEITAEEANKVGYELATPAQKDIRSRKKNIKLNPVSMGIANFRRDRKKTVAIVASLSLGGIILLVVSSIVLLRSPEALARQFFPDGDYKIYLDSEMTEEKVMAAGNPLNEELKQEILSIDGVTDIIPSRQSLHATYKTEIHQAGGMCDMLTDQNYAAVEAALTEGTMPTDSRSIVIDYNVLKQNEDMGVGSTVEISLGEEQPSVSVTISGLYAPAKVYSGHGRMPLDGATLFAPEALFHELHPEITSFDYSWSIVNDPKKTDYVGAELKNIVASHSNIALDEINTVIEYEEMTNSFAFGSMEILSWLVFLFGVINLINTTLSNQIARKQENSILRSIGLTQKQLCKMNIVRGCAMRSLQHWRR